MYDRLLKGYFWGKYVFSTAQFIGIKIELIMMTPSNGNIFRVTDPMWGEYTGHRWISLTKASKAELWYFLFCVWTNGWANSPDDGDLRRRYAHYDVDVISNKGKGIILENPAPQVRIKTTMRQLIRISWD